MAAICGMSVSCVCKAWAPGKSRLGSGQTMDSAYLPHIVAIAGVRVDCLMLGYGLNELMRGKR